MGLTPIPCSRVDMEQGVIMLPVASLRSAQPDTHHTQHSSSLRVRKHLLMFCSALLLLLPSDLSPIAELVPPLKRIFILLFFFSVEMSCKEQNETVCRNSGLLLVEQYVIVYNAERIQPNNCKTTSKKKKKDKNPTKHETQRP